MPSKMAMRMAVVTPAVAGVQMMDWPAVSVVTPSVTGVLPLSVTLPSSAAVMTMLSGSPSMSAASQMPAMAL